MRRLAAVAALTVLAAIAACGPSPAGPEPAAVSFEVLDPAPWESAWAPQELVTWREGVLVELAPGEDGRAHEVGPAGGATIEMFVPVPEGGGYVPGPVATTTSADGRFRVGPGPEQSWILRTSKEGYSPTWVGGGAGAALRGAIVTAPGDMRLAMRREHVVRGVVLDDGGHPVAGAHVVAACVAYREELTTDADGRFVARAPVGPVVFATDDPRWDAKPLAVTIPPFGATPPVTIAARQAEPVRGWVQSTDGRRLAGAVVLSVEDPSIRTRSGADGRFELRAPRSHHVAALVGGYGWRSNAIPRAGDLEMRLPPASGLKGFVVDAQGRPVPDARLTAVVLNFEGLFERVRGPRTGPDGSFDFAWLPRPPRGVSGSARILARKRGLGESAIVQAADCADGVRLTLNGTRDVSGRVLRADGTPLPGAAVQAKWGHWDGGITPAEVAVLGVDEEFLATTDADGRWRIGGVPLGLHAKVRCTALGVVHEQFLDESAAAAAAPVDFTFAPGVSIAGRVVGADGAAAEGPARVTAQLLNAQGVEVSRGVQTDASGAFRFDDLPPGSYQIRAEADRYDIPGGAVVAAGEVSAVVKVERSASLTVKLSFEGGAVPDVPLALTLLPAAAGSQQFRRVISAGCGGDPIELRGVYPGTWKLGISGDVWRASDDHVELADGASRVVELVVRRTLRISAKLTDTDGRPIGRQLVVFAPVAPAGGAAQSVVSRDDGTCDLTGLAPGRWLASAEPPKTAPLRVEFEVKDGENPPLDLRVPPYGTIVVRVARDNGDPIPDAVAVIGAPDGTSVDAWEETGLLGRTNRFRTNSEGRATIYGVRTGPVHVDVRSEPALLKSVDVQVQPGKVVTVDVP